MRRVKSTRACGANSCAGRERRFQHSGSPGEPPHAVLGFQGAPYEHGLCTVDMYRRPVGACTRVRADYLCDDMYGATENFAVPSSKAEG